MCELLKLLCCCTSAKDPQHTDVNWQGVGRRRRAQMALVRLYWIWPRGKLCSHWGLCLFQPLPPPPPPLPRASSSSTYSAQLQQSAFHTNQQSNRRINRFSVAGLQTLRRRSSGFKISYFEGHYCYRTRPIWIAMWLRSVYNNITLSHTHTHTHLSAGTLCLCLCFTSWVGKRCLLRWLTADAPEMMHKNKHSMHMYKNNVKITARETNYHKSLDFLGGICDRILYKD